MKTKLSVAVVTILDESLVDRKKLDFKFSQEKMNYNLIDHNGIDGYRVSFDLNTLTVSTSSLEGYMTEKSEDNIVICCYELPDSPVYLTQNYLDIPVLDAAGVNYLYMGDLSKVSECIQVLPQDSIILTMQPMTAGRVHEELDEHCTVMEIDWEEVIPGLNSSAGLLSLMQDLMESKEISADDALEEISKILYRANTCNSHPSAGQKELEAESSQSILEEIGGSDIEANDNKMISQSKSDDTVGDQLENLPLSVLGIDKKYQARALEDESAKSDLETAYRNNETVPPISVVKTPEDKLFVVDGFHRIEGARRAGLDTISCIIIYGTEEDAFKIALGANEENKAVKRSDADKRKAVNMALDSNLFTGYSNRKIANICKVSAGLVDRVVGERKEAVAPSPKNHISDNLGNNTQDKMVDTIHNPISQEERYDGKTSSGDDTAYMGNSNTEPSRPKKRSRAKEHLENEILKLDLHWVRYVGRDAHNGILTDLQDVIDTYIEV